MKTRLTLGEYDLWPVWSRDGRSIAFSPRRRDVTTGAERPPVISEMDKTASSWFPDER